MIVWCKTTLTESWASCCCEKSESTPVNFLWVYLVTVYLKVTKMAFFRGLKSFFSGVGGGQKSKKDLNKYIKTGIDPSELWEIVGELGDGAFGKVYKVSTLSYS